MTNRLTFEEFETRARQIHDSVYTYHRDSFVAGNKKIRITCPEHGDFEQRADSHLAGQKCRECGYLLRHIPVPNSARRQAQTDGLPTYISGELCPKGHNAPRRTHNGECTQCITERKERQRYHSYHIKSNSIM